MAYRPTPLKIFGAFIKFLFVSLIALICGILIWRIAFSTAVPGYIKKISVNERLLSAYSESDGELDIFRQNHESITRDKEIEGFFWVVDCIFIPEAEQIQLVFRYNNSTLGHLKEDYNLDAVPHRALDHFDISLVKTTDLTPEDPTDNDDNDTLREERYFPSYALAGTTTLYNYRRVVFEGITAGDALEISFQIYYTGDADYGEAPYGSLILYDADTPSEPVKLRSSDRRVIDGK